MIERFVAFCDAVNLVSIEAALGPDQASDWVVTLIRSDAVRLKGSCGVVRFTETTEVETARYARRAADRPAPARYNPFARGRAASVSTGSSQRRRPDPRDWLSNYAVHLNDLQRSIAREFGIQLSLSNSAGPRQVEMPAVTGQPIADLLAFLKVHGLDPEFAGYPRDRWMAAATQRGIAFEPRHFDAAWEVAKEAGHVAPLKGAPKKILQAKRRLDVPAASTLDPDGVAPRKAGGA